MYLGSDLITRPPTLFRNDLTVSVPVGRGPVGVCMLDLPVGVTRIDGWIVSRLVFTCSLRSVLVGLDQV